MSKKPTEVAVAPKTVVSTEVPSYLANAAGVGRGMEEVTTNDMIIPRLELVQSLSPVRDKTSSSYIPGSEEGNLFNNVTREMYGNEVLVVPVMYKKQWLIWKDRKQGGGANGFRGAFNTELEAKHEVMTLSQEEKGLEISETAQHFCIVIKADGSTDEVVISMAKSKIKVSKRWNSIMRIAGGDSFSRVYKVSSIVEANANGEKYQNLAIAGVGYAPEPVYRQAEALYTQITKGGVVIDNSVDGEAVPGRGNEEF